MFQIVQTKQKESVRKLPKLKTMYHLSILVVIFNVFQSKYQILFPIFHIYIV